MSNWLPQKWLPTGWLPSGWLPADDATNLSLLPASPAVTIAPTNPNKGVVYLATASTPTSTPEPTNLLNKSVVYLATAETPESTPEPTNPNKGVVYPGQL